MLSIMIFEYDYINVLNDDFHYVYQDVTIRYHIHRMSAIPVIQ